MARSDQDVVSDLEALCEAISKKTISFDLRVVLAVVTSSSVFVWATLLLSPNKRVAHPLSTNVPATML